MSVVPFNLSLLPTEGERFPWRSHTSLEYKAVSALSRLDGMMIASAKANLFWLTWLMKEAQCSNVIEGTVTTFDEIMGENAGVVVPLERRDDVSEVLNYHNAMIIGIEMIEQGYPLSLSFIKSLHAKLLDGNRGANKNPGQFRQTQVHIGMPGSSMEQAFYVPPDPIYIQDLLDNLIVFLSREDINPITRTAIMHAQFELIHPFLDGNGRMGRLLISLFLTYQKVLNNPCFYMSAYLQRHRSRYYDCLNKISKEGDWNSWLTFFLEAVIEHSRSNADLLVQMTHLYEKSKADFSIATNSSYAISVLDYVFTKPIFSIPDMLKNSTPKMTKQVAIQVINKLISAGLIEKIAEGKGRKPSRYRFPNLLRLLS